METKFTKFGVEHTCTCGKNSGWPNDKLTKFIGCDFKRKKSDGFKGYVWFASKCTFCGHTFLHGSSFADYRTTGDQLLYSAMDEVKHNYYHGGLTNEDTELLKCQFYGKKYAKK